MNLTPRACLLSSVLAGLVACAAAAGAPGRSAGSCPAGVASAGMAKPRAGSPVVRYQAKGIAVGATKALVGGFVPAGGTVSLLAEYGRGPRYGSCTLWRRNVAPETVVKLELAGLQPSATYHVRLVAKSAAGVVAVGADRRFSTLAGGRIPQGVKVGTIAIGGMTRASAIALLGRSLGSPLRVGFEGALLRASRTEAGGRVDSAHTVAAALTAWPDQALPVAPVTVDRGRLDAFLTSLSRRWAQARREASVKLVGERAVVQPAKPGIEVDTKRMAAIVGRELTTGSRQLLALSVETTTAVSEAPEKAVVVRLGSQTLTAYLNGKPVLTAPITSGRPALPTPVGSYYVHFRASPYVFTSPWAPGSAYYYPPTPVTWAMYFYDNDFLHDDPAEPSSAFGAGSNFGPYASHGCVHVPHDDMAFLYNWLPVGAPVIVSQT